MIDIKQEVRYLKGVGEARSKIFKSLGIETVEDLLYYFPRDWRDFSNIKKISDVKINEKAAIKVKVLKIKKIPIRRRRFSITEALVADETGTLKVLWFNQPYLLDYLVPGTEVFLAGTLELDKEPILKHPEYEILKPGEELKHLGRVIPVYHETSGITSRQLRGIIKEILDNFIMPDFLPEGIKRKNKFYNLKTALCEIHFPANWKSLNRAKERLSFDEVFIPSLAGVLFKQEAKKEMGQKIKIDISQAKKFKDSLPFTLTNSQRKAIWQIVKDIEKEEPMNRLLEGDVGSGKTIVAAFVLMLVAKAGYQGVLMVPTEILAWEHFSKIKDFLKGFGIKTEILTGSVKLKDKKDILQATGQGKIDILIGTHALIGEKLNFKNLGLAVIDEQHRFGVNQRKALCEKNKKIMPHFLSMTATPIPRTMALTVYGDLDISYLKEMPKGERKVKTFLVPPEKRMGAYDFINKEIKKGGQAFVICPTILESDKLGVRAVEEEYKKLSGDIFKNVKLDFLHGRIKPEEKQKKMLNFKKGVTKILISTSVVEVGIDIPNLTIMIIENADRFGLSQLHQLRGRIGRAGQKAYFLLFTESENELTLKRLNALTKINDGFKLSEFDLSLRGPGEIFGNKQSGFFEFKLASFMDFKLIKSAKEDAEKIVDSIIKYPLLKNKAEELKKGIHLE